MDNPRPGQVHGRVFLKNGWSCSNTRTALAMYVNENFFLAEAGSARAERPDNPVPLCWTIMGGSLLAAAASAR
jgi:hypothetical protein